MEKKEILEAVHNEINFLEAVECKTKEQENYVKGAMNALKMIEAKLNYMFVVEETRK